VEHTSDFIIYLGAFLALLGIFFRPTVDVALHLKAKAECRLLFFQMLFAK